MQLPMLRSSDIPFWFGLGFGLLTSRASAGCHRTCELRASDIAFNDADHPETKLTYFHQPFHDDLQTKNDDIEYLVYFNHGAQVDADNYFCIMEETLKMQFCSEPNIGQSVCQERLKNIYVVSPMFRDRDHHSQAGYYCWTNAYWTQGQYSREETEGYPDCGTGAGNRVMSFSVIDRFLELALGNFPHLKEVVISGHSAGGQTVVRYALGTETDFTLEAKGIKVSYVAANPSTVPYLDNRRAVRTVNGCDPDQISNEIFQFKVPSNTDAFYQDCPDYDDWKFGLQQLNTYMSRLNVSTMIDNFRNRKIQLIASQDDVCCAKTEHECSCPSTSIDDKCAADAQGICRFQRMNMYDQYLSDYFEGGNVNHQFLAVPGYGHDACVFQDESVREIMFATIQASGACKTLLGAGLTALLFSLLLW